MKTVWLGFGAWWPIRDSVSGVVCGVLVAVPYRMLLYASSRESAFARKGSNALGVCRGVCVFRNSPNPVQNDAAGIIGFFILIIFVFIYIYYMFKL